MKNVYDQVYARPQLFVGVSGFGTLREVFRSTCPAQTHPAPTFDYVVGPFETRRAADWFALYGVNNPHVTGVRAAERIARRNFGIFGQWVIDQGEELTEWGTIVGPGKFEGEPFACYIYHMQEEGDDTLTDASGTIYSVFKVSAKERRWYYLPDGTTYVVIWDSDDGFAMMATMTTAEYEDFAEKCNSPLVLAEDGYADGGEPYTDEELAIINSQ